MDEPGAQPAERRTATPADARASLPATALTPPLPVAPTPSLPVTSTTPSHRPVHVVDVEEPTIRRAGDLVNAILSTLGLLVVFLLAIYGRETTEGVTQDVQEVVDRTIRDLLLLPIQLIEGVITFAIPVAVAVSLIIKRYWRTLMRAAIAGLVGTVLALVGIQLIDMLPLLNPLRLGMTLDAQRYIIPALSPFMVALASILTAVGKSSHSSPTRWSWYALLLVLVLAVLQGDLNIVGATASLLLGRIVGYLTRWGIGVHSTRASGSTLVAGLRKAGLDPERVVRVDAGPGEPRAWFVTSAAPVGYNAQFRFPEYPSSGDGDVAGSMRVFSPAFGDSITPDPAAIDEDTYRLMGSRRAPALSGPRRYAVWSNGQKSEALVLDDDRQVVGFLANLWETVRIRGTDPRVSPGLRESAERAALMSFAASAAGVRTPQIRGMARIADSVIFVEDHIAGGRHLDELTEASDSVLDAVWIQLRTAHDQGIAHRSLTAEHIIVDENDEPWIIGWSDGDIAANELSRRIDLSQMLTLLAVQFGSQRALTSANRNLTEGQLASIAPLLQRVTLPAGTRALVTRKTLGDLREALTRLIPTADAELLQLRRFSPKTLLAISLLLFAVFLVLGSLNFEEVVASFRQANPWWLLAAFAAGLSTYVGAALGLVAFTAEKIGVWRTTLVEVAAAIVSIVAPAGVGPAAVEIRYLTKQGIAAPLAVATVSLTMVSRFAGTIVMLLLVAFMSGRGGSITLPSTALLIGIALVIGAVGILVAIPALRNWAWQKVQPAATQIWPRLVWVLGSPRRLLIGFLGALVMTTGYVLAFGLALAAFGHTLPVAVLAITYLASSAAGSLVPTPAGIGAVELALTSGLTVAGIPASVALSATLIFRVLTLWARVPLGWLALRHLQKTNAL